MSLRSLAALAVLFVAVLTAAPVTAHTSDPAPSARVLEQAGAEEPETTVFTYPAIYTDSPYLMNSRRSAQAQHLNQSCDRLGTTFVEPTCVQIIIPQPGEQGLAKRKSRGILGKLLGGIVDPLLAPLTDGLDNVRSSLNNTSCNIRGLSPPMKNLRDPIHNLAEPMCRLRKPLHELRQPMQDLVQPMADLRQPLSDLRQPMQDLSQPVASLSQSAGSLGAPMNKLSREVARLSNPLAGMAQPLTGVQQPLRDLVDPLRKMPAPLNALVAPLQGMQAPLQQLPIPIIGLSRSIDKLQGEMLGLRSELDKLHTSILEIGRNITLAIVFGMSVVAYAIWTHRKVPAVEEPTVQIVEPDPVHPGSTIIHTEPASHMHPPPEKPPKGQGGPPPA